jgi:hypothetical protein
MLLRVPSSLPTTSTPLRHARVRVRMGYLGLNQ